MDNHNNTKEVSKMPFENLEIIGDKCFSLWNFVKKKMLKVLCYNESLPNWSMKEIEELERGRQIDFSEKEECEDSGKFWFSTKVD